MNITTPGGLITGPAGGCSDSMCCNAATRVLVHFNPEARGVQDVRIGAYCLPCMSKKVVPREIYEAEVLHTESFRPGMRVPDDSWELREFTDEEAVEIAAIHSGELLCTYMGSGMWDWRRQA
ncbi:hypothetical protein ACFY1P_21685 [Streptomyces sp. NPDC001407]|uniref:hypothetical protein n=1 Tax=unclassified Streptomyces TaxID=2593676 RepID=UPI0036BFA618